MDNIRTIIDERQYLTDPMPEDLCDLFNFSFNKPNSCFIKDLNLSQSNFLFIEKFGGNEGLIRYLKSSFDNVPYLTNVPRDSRHHRAKKKVIFDETRGIKDDDEIDKQFRIETYGQNYFPKR